MHRRPLQLVFSRASLLVCLLLILVGPWAVASAQATELIQSFHADIDLAKSGKLTVTETIRVVAEGNRIKRGIYRDFPLTFVDGDGRMRRVDFTLLRVKRDGQAENYKTEDIENGIRIYLGSEDVLLTTGEHSYTIVYETDRQIRYFDGHDELFWNVTGNGWKFAILSASATVSLPAGVEPEGTTFFTGSLGATEKKATVSQTANLVSFETTFPLNIEQGLTIGIKLPKGAIDPPSAEDEARWRLHDWRNTLVALPCLLVVLVYFGLQWLRVGRDPSRGVVVPRWDPPAGLSPALVNYVANRGFSNGGWTAFSASIIDLAVKGLIKLDDLSSAVSMKPTGKTPAQALPLGEDKIYNAVRGHASLSIDKANGARIQTIGEEFRSAIEKEHSGKYHRHNAGVITLGILLTVVAAVVILMLADFTDAMLGLMMIPAVCFLVVTIFSWVLSATALASTNVLARIVAWTLLGVFWLAFALILLVSVWAAVDTARSPDDLLGFLASMSIIVVAAGFTTIMGAATPLGRQLRDGIEGLRLYLTVAEKNRMNMAGAPAMSPQHFETLLPYAVALGVEEPWSQHFQTWLDAAGTAAAAYQPLWYGGTDFDAHRFGDRIGGFSSSLSSTISSSLPPPPQSSSSGFSSSSGGGGSSGSGGGGGGGGGW